MTTAAVDKKVGKSTPAHGVSFNEALRVWAKLALLASAVRPARSR